MRSTVRASYSECQRITRQAGSSFPLAFRLLSRPKAASSNALYAFFRITDDLADSNQDLSTKRQNLARWREQFHAATTGIYTHPIHAALHRTLQSYPIEVSDLNAVIEGVTSDLEPRYFATFEDLYPYCYQVASAVGLACLPVWGVSGDYRPAAEAAGIAFQLTNILRDLDEDRKQNRVYLPQSEWQEYGSPPESWAANSEAFRRFMAFQVTRARDYYQKSNALDSHLSAEGRAVFSVMKSVYARLLDEIELRSFDVFSERVRVKRRDKLRIFLAAWPIKWGLR